MRACFAQIQQLAGMALNAVGCFMEIGVWRGDTFVDLARFARQHKRQCVAVDSFEGMAEPTERDRDLINGILHFEKGCLSGGIEAFERVSAEPNAVVFKGYIPEVLRKINIGPIAFVHLDVDQYMPTAAALEWIWARLSAGGILVAHDWDSESKILAAAAINEWAASNKIALNGLPSNHAWVKKEK